jgi:MFS family permease
LRTGAGVERGAPVKPPTLAALQLFNALISTGSILALMLGTVRWTAWEWSAWQIGMVTTLANLCYGGLVFIGGRLADRWGRARSGILGSAIGLAGCLWAMVSDQPAATVAAAMCGMAGAAMFFPGSAGLFSDAEGASGGSPPALHRKIRRYNLGWAGATSRRSSASASSEALRRGWHTGSPQRPSSSSVHRCGVGVTCRRVRRRRAATAHPMPPCRA